MDVQGRLRQSLDFWEEVLQLALWIIRCIREGYKLPLQAGVLLVHYVCLVH